jgi:hypothetical protein
MTSHVKINEERVRAPEVISDQNDSVSRRNSRRQSLLGDTQTGESHYTLDSAPELKA